MRLRSQAKLLTLSLAMLGLFSYIQHPQQMQDLFPSNLDIDSINRIQAESPSSAGGNPTYQAQSGRKLTELLSELSNSAGVEFVSAIDISNHIVKQSFSTDNLTVALKSLLAGFNYSVIEKNATKLAIISSYNGSAPSVTPAKQPQITFLGKEKTDLPAAFQNYPNGSVTSLNLPIAEILAQKQGDSLVLDLPIGKLTASHDYSTEDVIGNKTWIGHLANEGIGYRVTLSQGAAGIIGNINTPQGSFAIESNANNIYLIDTRAFSSLGYEGDEA